MFLTSIRKMVFLYYRKPCQEKIVFFQQKKRQMRAQEKRFLTCLLEASLLKKNTFGFFQKYLGVEFFFKNVFFVCFFSSTQNNGSNLFFGDNKQGENWLGIVVGVLSLTNYKNKVIRNKILSNIATKVQKIANYKKFKKSPQKLIPPFFSSTNIKNWPTSLFVPKIIVFGGKGLPKKILFFFANPLRRVVKKYLLMTGAHSPPPTSKHLGLKGIH